MQRCSKCILPESYPDIKFNEDGVCNLCLNYENRWGQQDYEESERELQTIFDKWRNKGKRYDCVVPLSGGKDSTYTLYICRKIYNLKVLAVNFDNGFRSIQAIKNMENATKRLGVSYISYGPNWELMKKLYALFLKKTGQFCFPCDMGIWATVRRVAEQESVPMIISGFSMQFEHRGRKIYSYNNRLFKNVAQGSASVTDMKDFLEATNSQKILRRLRHFRFSRYRIGLSLPDYIPWDENEIEDVITKELGWSRGDSEQRDHIDCIMAPIKNYLVIKKWGFGEKTTKYSNMIRAGYLTREEALKKVTIEEPNTEPAVMATFMQKLGLTRQDIDTAKDKSHLDYF